MSGLRWAALTWFLIIGIAGLSLHPATRGDQPLFTSDLLALLPPEPQSSVLAAAEERLVSGAERRVIVLLGGTSVPQLTLAADAFERALAEDVFEPADPSRASAVQSWFEAALAQRRGLLADEDRGLLAASPIDPSYWQQRALQRLYAPVPVGGISWRDDPFGWFSSWASSVLAQLPPVTIRDGRAWLETESGTWAVVDRQLRVSPLSRVNQRRIAAVLADATGAARQAAAGLEVVRAGVVFHAIAGASRAEHEIAFIGGFSALFVVILLIALFGSPWPVVSLLLPVISAMLFATAFCVWVFGQVHLLTLVFGATLIGVTIDYAIHVSSRSWSGSDASIATVMPALALAGVSTVLAYLVLASSPLPGLRQMGVFCAVGVVAAWLSSVLWLPMLPIGRSRFGPMARWLGATVRLWPHADRRAFFWGLPCLLLAAVLCSALLETQDDVRQLLTPDARLVVEQKQMDSLLRLPSPAQFFVVSGATPEETLQREETLRGLLAPLKRDQTISGWLAISEFFPSAARRRATQVLQDRVLDDRALMQTLNGASIGDPGWPSQLRQASAAQSLEPADIEQLLSDSPLASLWLGESAGGYATIVALRGVRDEQPLRNLTKTLGETVSWVDRAGRATRLLGEHRMYLSLGLIAAYAVVGCALWWRFTKAFWRILAAPAIASILTLTVLAVFDVHLSLFLVAALFLVLGVGLDFGIFLAHQKRHFELRWAAVSAGAMSTMVSIGMLAFSTTTVLHTFGITTLLGVFLAWVLAPVFCTARS